MPDTLANNKSDVLLFRGLNRVFHLKFFPFTELFLNLNADLISGQPCLRKSCSRSILPALKKVFSVLENEVFSLQIDI